MTHLIFVHQRPPQEFVTDDYAKHRYLRALFSHHALSRSDTTPPKADWQYI
jgi:hypothetical protein